MITILLFGAVFLGAGAFLFHQLGSRDDRKLFDGPGRWILTLVLLAWIGLTGQSMQGGGAAGAIVGLVAVIPALVILAMIWIPVLVEGGLSGLTGAMTGGNQEVDAKPYYFRATALRRKGDLTGALEEIQAQLTRFPFDWEGTLLKSEIQIENLDQPSTAIADLLAYESQEDLDPGSRNLSRFRRADIQLHHLKDPAAAREVLEAIRTAAPNSESARIAEQHLAHLESGSLASTTRMPIQLVHRDIQLGLTADLGASQTVETDPNAEANQLLQALEAHPLNWEARENLATLYSERFGRPDLAILELRQLASMEGMAEKRIVSWLNRIADNHLRISPPDLDGARSALEEIQVRFPESVGSIQASQRISLLQRSARNMETRAPIKIGEYEQNIGLKRGSADIPNPNPNP